jgi:hypothetical protein
MRDEDKIRELAKKFRESILKCEKSELPLSLSNFPTGSCSDASMLLGTYFKNNDINGFIQIKGKRGEVDSFETHYWLEKDGILVDITADQFAGINEAVIVTGSNSKWHGTFNREILQEADYRMISARDVRNHFEAVYSYIIEENNSKR